MRGHTYSIVDVFAERRYAGNQLAVVEDADSLSTDRMTAIAREFGFSETTFIESNEPRNGGYDVRIFTPTEEIPFAGHPTLGTAYVIRETIADPSADEIVLNLPVGRIPVWAEPDGDGTVLWMEQQRPTFGRRFDHEMAATVLGLEPSTLDHERPVRAISTGLPTVIVPLLALDALKRISIDRAAYDEFVADHDAKNVLAFCPDSRADDTDVAARVFAPYYDVPEDPATGSSNGCLAAYLSRHEFFGSDEIDVRVEQGYEMGRPSLLHLRAHRRGGHVDVSVGGRVLPVARGHLTRSFG